jgi:serine protease Do
MLLRRTLTLAAVVALLAPVACKRHIPIQAAGADIEQPADAPTPDAPPAQGANEKAPSAEAPPLANGKLTLSTGFAPVVERVASAVVNISSTRTVKPSASEQNPFFNDPLFRDFFGRGPLAPHERRERALGSGVIVSSDGFVLTNSHVVSEADEVRVMLPDKRELKAKIVGQDPKTDVALLRIPGSGFPTASFGDSSRVKVGDFVLAIGDPLGLGQTVTMGIISAKGRGNVGIVDYEDFIQTDAAINPGNSGGALVNVEGQLIGLNTAIATTGGSGGNQGIGFAVPSNLAREVMAQIQAHGRVIRGWLGVAIQDVTPAMAKALGLPSEAGALVGDVTSDTPAAKAGLKRGDVIFAVDGQPVTDSRTLRLHVAESSPGTKLKLTVLRNGAHQDITVTLGEMPAEEKKSPANAPSATGAVGIQVAPLTPDLALRLEVPEGTSGVVVTGVEPGSRAADAGVRPGDLIQEVDHRAVKTPDDVRKGLEKDGKRPHVLLVFRHGVTHFVAIPAEGE